MIVEKKKFKANPNLCKVLDLAVTEEGDPSLGREGSTYQEYIVPAFLTQVWHDVADDDVGDYKKITNLLMIIDGQSMMGGSSGDLLLGNVPHQRVFHIRESSGDTCDKKCLKE